MEVALTQLGNEGGQPYWNWYGFGGRVEWCACFASWCADQCGYLESGIIPKFSLCSDGVNWFKGKGQWRDKNYEPQAGDLIFFDWGSNGSIDHVGIVEKCENGTVYTVGGQLWRCLQTAELFSREQLNLWLWSAYLLAGKRRKKTRGSIPLALLLYISRKIKYKSLFHYGNNHILESIPHFRMTD